MPFYDCDTCNVAVTEPVRPEGWKPAWRDYRPPPGEPPERQFTFRIVWLCPNCTTPTLAKPNYEEIQTTLF